MEGYSFMYMANIDPYVDFGFDIYHLEKIDMDDFPGRTGITTLMIFEMTRENFEDRFQLKLGTSVGKYIYKSKCGDTYIYIWPVRYDDLKDSYSINIMIENNKKEEH